MDQDAVSTFGLSSCYKIVTTEVVAHLCGRNSGFLEETVWQDPAKDLTRVFSCT